MLRFFCKIWLRLNGWNTHVTFPLDIKKCVIIVGPHTSSWDFIIGVAYRSVMGLGKAKFLGKEELFKGPFGFLFKLLGGTPVDRLSKQNMVEQAIEWFNENEIFRLALSPEATRKKVERLRTGFYHIAKGAKVPIVMVGLDFKNKTLVISDPFYPGDNETEDFRHIIQFFASIEGKYPELGMKHLLTEK